MFVDRKLEGKTEPTCGGDRPRTRESLGFEAFGGEKSRASTRCSGSCTRKRIAIGKLGWEEKKDRLDWVDILDRIPFISFANRNK
jgi:hypothetical protein